MNDRIDESGWLQLRLEFEGGGMTSTANTSGGCSAEDDLCSGCNACQIEEVMALEKEGHTFHCACRMICGDGECECQTKDAGSVPK